jgi:hypothetical protein
MHWEKERGLLNTAYRFWRFVSSDFQASIVSRWRVAQSL